MIYFIDDLTMCKKERKYQGGALDEQPSGMQPSILELIRQHLDHKQWYDATTLDKKTIEEVQFASCITCNPSNPTSALQLLNQRN